MIGQGLFALLMTTTDDRNLTEILSESLTEYFVSDLQEEERKNLTRYLLRL